MRCSICDGCHATSACLHPGTSTVNTGLYSHDLKAEVIAARDKWWIDRVGEDIIEVFLNVPMNDANKETLLKTWQRLKWNF